MKRLLTFYFLFSTLCSSAQYMIYGTTGGGGANKDGLIFSYNPITDKETVLFSFNDTDGYGPEGRLLYASDSLLYGFTGKGGMYDMGAVFSFNPKTNQEKVIINFDSTNGYQKGQNGMNELIQGKDGLLYGSSWAGGKYGKGVLFSYDIHTHKDSIRCNFNDSTSQGQYGGAYMELWQDAVSGMLYGVTQSGGYPGHGGVIYGFNPANNKLTRYVVATDYSHTPWNFSSGLILGKNGLLYGITQTGGTLDSGTIYSFDITSHSMQMVFSFDAKGGRPNTNELLQLSNGLLYGGTIVGNQINGRGCLYSFNPVNKTEKILVTFNGINGSNPSGNLIQDPDNSFIYGVTYVGGDSSAGVLFSYDTAKSIYTKLLDFAGLNGAYPLAGLTLVKDTSVHVPKDTTGLGMSSVKYESRLAKVYPNPANTLLNLEINLADGQIAYFTMYNDIGEKIENMQLSNSITILSIGNLPSGMYYYRITDTDGNLVKADKQMIAH